MKKLKRGKASALQDKLFINDSRLTVVGEKIKLLKLPGDEQGEVDLKTLGHRYETPVKTLPRVVRCVNTNGGKAYSNKVLYEVKTTYYRNRELCNDKLKDIYEAIEVEEFKRLLKVFNNGNELNRCGKERLISTIDAEKVYNEHFQDHYDFLKELVELRKG